MVTIDRMPKILKYHDASPYPPIVITGLALGLALLAAWLFGGRFVVFENKTPVTSAAQTNFLINTDATP